MQSTHLIKYISKGEGETNSAAVLFLRLGWWCLILGETIRRVGGREGGCKCRGWLGLRIPYMWSHSRIQGTSTISGEQVSEHIPAW